MNDTSVPAAVRSRLTQARESLTDVHMGVPVGDILDLARRRRARHRHAALAVAAAAGTSGSLALAAALLASGGAAPSGAGPAQLTAWTVSRQANGEVTATIRELKDPAGLQRKLRADGVPASVGFENLNPACRQYSMSQAQERQVYPQPSRQLPHDVVIVIRPSALPSGTGVQMSITLPRRNPGPTVTMSGLVYASPGCTGT
jgi:hypothetical protein